jgi:hypothetical protein
MVFDARATYRLPPEEEPAMTAFGDYQLEI